MAKQTCAYVSVQTIHIICLRQISLSKPPGGSAADDYFYLTGYTGITYEFKKNTHIL
jgi:hypothetical protein